MALYSRHQIFISYRRDDGIDTAQLLYVHLNNIFGEGAAFLDTRSMKTGQEYPLELRQAVYNSKVIIAMIGLNWKGIDPLVNRLEDETDWVRKELEIACADRKKPIFPVFVKGAKSRNAFVALPSSIERLTKANYIELREKEFALDLLPLISEIELHIQLNDPLKDLSLDEYQYKYPEGSPFKGLDYFTEKDAKIFFGRGIEIRKLYNNIKNRNIVFLYGQSGSGKSSLLFAGIKPRLEHKGWTVKYFRLETGINLVKELNDHMSSVLESTKQLVILDQVEEIFTNPDVSRSPEVRAQLLLSCVRQASKRIHVLVSFRKEYLAEMKKLFTDIHVKEIYLEALQLKGVLEAISGITQSQGAKDTYELEFGDPEVPLLIAQSVLSDEESHIAPLLQVILRKMWDKVENKKRIFTKELLQEVKSNSLITFLKDQIEAVSERFPEEVKSGLVLDVLYFFTSVRSTSASHKKEELLHHYTSIEITNLVIELKNKYLLSEPKEKTDETNDNDVIRLAHDSLAPLVRELYAQSNLPGQRAARLLESKRQDIDEDQLVEFSKADIITLNLGNAGMRKLTPAQERVIEKSRQQIQKNEMELEEKNRQLEEKNKQLEDSLKEIKAQTQIARARALATTAHEMMSKDPTIALRLAEAAYKLTPVPTKEAKSILVEIFKVKSVFYKRNYKVHTQSVNSVAFSPDGKHILTGSDDHTAKLWNIDGTLRQSIERHTDSVNSVAFSPDGKLILTGSNDRTAKLWNIDGTLIQSFEAYTHFVTSVAFSPDGKHILTGSNDRTAKLWNIDGTLIQSFEAHTHSVTSVAFSLDGKHILTGSDDRTAKLWNINGTLMQSFEVHTHSVNSVAFSPDGKHVLTGSDDHTAKLWNIDGTLRQSIERHTDSVNSVAFSPDGNHILTGSDDRTAKLWNIDGTLIQFFESYTHSVTSVAFSPDGNHILTGSDDHTAKLWNFDAGFKQSFEAHIHSVTSVAFSPDGKHILTGSDDHTAKLWNINGTLMQSFRHNTVVLSVTFSPDGQYVFTGGYDRIARLWKIDGSLKVNYLSYHGSVTSVAFSPDGKHLLTGSNDHIARLWHIDDGFKQSIKAHTHSVTSVTFSPNGKYILTGSNDRTAKLWNIDGTIMQLFEGHTDSVNSVAFSPDGKHILTGSDDHTAKLWNINGTIMRLFEGHTDSVNSVAFSPDGKHILTGSDDHTAKLWNIDGTIMQLFEGHTDSVNSVAFSPDGKHILTGSDDHTVRLWHAFWEVLNPKTTYILSYDEMKEYNIPKDI